MSAAFKQGALVELMPGEVARGNMGDQFRTLLGSCVAVVLTDPRRTVATMCHIVHVGEPTLAQVHNTAYGSVAMQRMFAGLRERAINPKYCEAYVFGGGNMFPQLYREKNVGATNVDWVQRYLADHGIALLAQNVGGNGYRKVSWTVGREEPMVEVIVAGQGARDAH